MKYLDLNKLNSAPLQTDPYEYVLLPHFMKKTQYAGLVDTYPKIYGPGSHPPARTKLNTRFRELIGEIESEDFRNAIAQKFNVDLAGKPQMITFRGYCRARDGVIHTDTRTKIITVLIYFNHPWGNDGGRLRVLNSGTDLDNYAAEVPPDNGAMLAFRRSEKSWHGHESFSGKRQAIQINWMTSLDAKNRESRKHRRSSLLKRWNPANIFAN